MVAIILRGGSIEKPENSVYLFTTESEAEKLLRNAGFTKNGFNGSWHGSIPSKGSFSADVRFPQSPSDLQVRLAPK